MLKKSLVGACIATMLAAGPALAHPHIFVDAELEVIADNSGNVAKLRNAWTFDEVFSSSVILDFDTNQDLKLDASELQKLATTIYGSLADYGYFTVVTHNGHDVKMAKPENFKAHYKDGQMSVTFDISPQAPTPAKGSLTFSIYDPTFYTAIDYKTDDHFKLDGKAFTACKRTVVRPDADKILSQNQSMMTESFFANPGGSDYGKMFATRLELACP